MTALSPTESLALSRLRHAAQPRAARKQSCASALAALATLATLLASILYIFALADNGWTSSRATFTDFPSELPVYDAPTHTVRVSFGIFQLCSTCMDGVCPGYAVNNEPVCVRTTSRSCSCPDGLAKCAGCGAWYSFTHREWAGLVAVRVLLVSATVLLLSALLVGVASVSRSELAPRGVCASTLGCLQIATTSAHACVLLAALLAIAAQAVWTALVEPDIRIFGAPPDGRGLAYYGVSVGYGLCFVAAVVRIAELKLWRDRAALIRASESDASESRAGGAASFAEDGRAPLLTSDLVP